MRSEAGMFFHLERPLSYDSFVAGLVQEIIGKMKRVIIA